MSDKSLIEAVLVDAIKSIIDGIMELFNGCKLYFSPEGNFLSIQGPADLTMQVLHELKYIALGI